MRKLLRLLGYVQPYWLQAFASVILMAGDHDNPEPRTLGHCGIVGERRGLVCAKRGGVAVRLEKGSIAEDLGRLRPPQMRPWHRLGNGAAAIDALQRVGERYPQDGAIDTRRRQSFQAVGNVGRPHEGAGGVMNGDKVRCLGCQRFQAIQHRVLAAGASFDRWRQVEAADGRLVMCLITGTDHDLDPVDARGRPENRQGAAQDGLAGYIAQRSTEREAA